MVFEGLVPRVKSGYHQLDGGRLYYEVVGRGEPLVLLHAFTLHSGMWDEQIEAFSRHHRVVRLDLRGFGRSSPPLHPYRHADDVGSLLNGLGIERAHLLGISMGGGIAIDFALAHPRMILSLVCADANVGGFRHWSDDFESSFAELHAIAREQGIEQAKARWLQHSMFAPALTDPSVERRLAGLIADYSGWHFLHEDPQSPTPPAIDRLAEIRVPTLVMIGEHDLREFQEMARILADLPAAVGCVRIEGVGHMSNLEAPEIFNREVLHFLGRQQGGGARD